MENEKILVEVCVGTACFVMGSSNLLEDLKEELPEHLKGKVELVAKRCLDLCKTKSGSNSPFVKINGEPMEKASLHKVIEKLEEIAK
jgi:NADH:ubiquinone oxidoreductase subunit E